MPGEPPIALRHLDYSGRGNTQRYTAKQSGGGPNFKLVPRQRTTHAAKLRGDLQSVQLAADRLKLLQELAPYEEDAGINLEIRGKAGFPLDVEPLDAAPKTGVDLKNVRYEKTVDPGGIEKVTTIATVFVRHGRLSFLVKRVEDYAAARQTIIRTGKLAGQVRMLDHEPLIANIESIGVAAIDAFWTSRHPLPEFDVITWWEVWVRAGSKAETARHEDAVIAEAQRLGMERRPERLVLPEHTVFLIKTSRRTLAAAPALLNFVSELRHPALAANFFIEQRPSEQRQWADNLSKRIQLPDDNAPAVCILDSGVNRGHPLLAPLLAETDHDTVHEEWGKDDHLLGGHGTQMAGLAAYGDLVPLLASNEQVRLSHWIESVKILPRVGSNEPQHYGPLTQAAMSLAEQNAPRGREHIFALAVTASDAKEFTENGRPSAWSAAIDSYASGAMENDERRVLICVSGGNVGLENASQYPALNAVTAFGDPAQAWNAISVGAFTEKDIVADENGALLPATCIAKRGGLAPHSATTCLWTSDESRQWPLKPDVVFEGGNVAANESGEPDAHDSLSLLSTHSQFQSRLFTAFGDTSAATALAARMAAQIQSSYSHFWTETVRALIVHSADWTPEMKLGSNLAIKGHVENVLQRFGHGVPDLGRALQSIRSRATLICQDSLQPFEKVGSDTRTRDMMLYRLPWPKDLLQEHGSAAVQLRVTLSYFIEPNPGARMVTSKYRYAGCNLRFAMQTATERSVKNFIARVSSAISEEDRSAYKSPGDTTDGWLLGDKLRRRGSIHSDTWTGEAAQLAEMEHLIVYPVNGWWRLRKQLGRCNHRVRYSLVITLETVGVDLDVFTPISNAISISV